MIFVVLVIFWKEDRVTHFVANCRYNHDEERANCEAKNDDIDIITGFLHSVIIIPLMHSTKSKEE